MIERTPLENTFSVKYQSNEACDAVFIVKQMQENFRVKGKKHYSGFVDLEKLLIDF